MPNSAFLLKLTLVSVLSAIRKWDKIGPKKFLKLYRFQEARDWEILFGGERYFCRPIAAVAYAYAMEKGPLKNKHFNGAVDKKLRVRLKKLGFQLKRRAA